MIGDTILVRDCDGRPLKRVFCGTHHGGIMICHPNLFDRVLKGEARAIKFPPEAVFKFDELVYSEIQANSTSWERAIRYECG